MTVHRKGGANRLPPFPEIMILFISLFLCVGKSDPETGDLKPKSNCNLRQKWLGVVFVRKFGKGFTRADQVDGGYGKTGKTTGGFCIANSYEIPECPRIRLLWKLKRVLEAICLKGKARRAIFCGLLNPVLARLTIYCFRSSWSLCWSAFFRSFPSPAPVFRSSLWFSEPLLC